MSALADRHCHVAIIGGGIAGLALALILERTNVSFVLWEARESIVSETGAGIGLLPSGLRILDQLGILEQIEAQTVPLRTWRHIDSAGETISVVEVHKRYQKTCGYEGRFLKRSQLLELLYNALQRKDVVKTSTRLSRIEIFPDHVKINSAGLEWATADVVVGADGVYSPVRKHIERLTVPYVYSDVQASIQGVETKIKPIRSQSTGAEFTCVFGISKLGQRLGAGESYAVFRKDRTVLVFTGKDGLALWFVFEHICKVGNTSNRPRYDANDIENTCLSVCHLALSPAVKFGDVFASRISVRKTVLEEGTSPWWYADRMTVIGDAAHVMAPHAAMGANQALESAAVLSNELLQVNQWVKEDIAAALERYTQMRQDRATAAIRKAGVACRAQLCCRGYEDEVKAIPGLSQTDWMASALASLRNAAVIQSLPLTKRGEYYTKGIAEFFEKPE